MLETHIKGQIIFDNHLNRVRIKITTSIRTRFVQVLMKTMIKRKHYCLCNFHSAYKIYKHYVLKCILNNNGPLGII